MVSGNGLSPFSDARRSRRAGELVVGWSDEQERQGHDGDGEHECVEGLELEWSTQERLLSSAARVAAAKVWAMASAWSR